MKNVLSQYKSWDYEIPWKPNTKLMFKLIWFLSKKKTQNNIKLFTNESEKMIHLFFHFTNKLSDNFCKKKKWWMEIVY